MEKFVEVKKKRMHVCCTGKGERRFLLLPGSGVCCPQVEYGKLIRELRKDSIVILIEKFGYGESDSVRDNRELDVVVKEYRLAAREAGIPMPVELLAHSMGFLEAVRWAQLYPEEITSILGIDPAVPESYRNFPIEQTLRNMGHLKKHPILRKAAAGCMSRMILRDKGLSQKEKEKLKRTVKKNYLSQAMISEAEHLPDNLKLLETFPKPVSTPMYFFISNGQGTTMGKEEWRDTLTGYLEDIQICGNTLFDAPHNLQAYRYREMAEIICRLGTKVL